MTELLLSSGSWANSHSVDSSLQLLWGLHLHQLHPLCLFKQWWTTSPSHAPLLSHHHQIPPHNLTIPFCRGEQCLQPTSLLATQHNIGLPSNKWLTLPQILVGRCTMATLHKAGLLMRPTRLSGFNFTTVSGVLTKLAPIHLPLVLSLLDEGSATSVDITMHFLTAHLAHIPLSTTSRVSTEELLEKSSRKVITWLIALHVHHPLLPQMLQLSKN